MIRKIVMLVLMLMYLYTLTFDLFLNDYCRLPAPLMFGLPLIFLFWNRKVPTFSFGWEIMFLFLANFLYYTVGQADLKELSINFIVFVTCSLFFYLFVDKNIRRFKFGVFLFFSFLALSTIVMFGDHLYPERVELLRAKLLGQEIVQSPSGLCTTIFVFGYQLSALVGFIFIYGLITKKNIIITGIILIGCLLSTYYGMQRSVFVAFIVSVSLFVLYYYRAKAIPILSSVVIFGFVFFLLVLKPHADSGSNIFTKNTQDNENNEDRSGLIKENLKIYSNYPFGLIFYNKQWQDVSKSNPTFSGGLTSHNAYLMFFTYLGPFLTIILLVAIYYSITKVFKRAIRNIQNKDFQLLVCLCFAFLAVSINALFHNAWLVNANGPTVFLYFAILHLNKMIPDTVNLDQPSAVTVNLNQSSMVMVPVNA